jgi:hypothetical protein
MFVDSNGMAVRCRIPDVVDTMEICDVDLHRNPSPSREWKPSTTLAYGTERCRGEVVVEKHIQTENTGVHQYDARHNEKSNTSPIGRGGETDMTGRRRVKAIQSEQKAVGHQTPQKQSNLVTGRDNGVGDEVAHEKLPRKPPDKGSLISAVEEIAVHQDGPQIPERLRGIAIMEGREGIRYAVDDGHQDVRFLIASSMRRGRERKETIRKDRRVPDQKNDVLRRLESLNTAAAHHENECCIMISKDLVQVE